MMTWFRKRVLNIDVNLSGYDLFLQDRTSKGGGVANLLPRITFSARLSPPSLSQKQFDLLVLSIQLSNISLLTVVGWYHPPSELACALPALSSLLAPYTKSEFVLLGDLNWDILKPTDQVLKQWDSLNLSQIITNPTTNDSKHPEKATLLDVILTNYPDRYQSGVFCNDLSDHCFAACVQNGCSVK